MTKYIQTGDYQIHPVAGHIQSGGQIVKVRPKTFELLLLLTEARGELVSKQEILRKIWDDVSVDEQVVFQSIKELRKIFNDASVIKTVPRKGYAWALPVEMIDLAEQRNSQENTAARSKAPRWMGTAILGLALALVVAAATLLPGEDKSAVEAGAVIVLPVANNLTDTDHRWVRYGAMDHLIRRLPASDWYGIYQTVDVLDVVKRAGLSSERFTRADISRIFSVTGAALVVESTLAGSPREYQLLYTLHGRGTMEKGAFLADRIDEALDRLAIRIMRRIGPETNISADTYRSEFANEMIATGLGFMQTDDFASAEKYLDAAVETEPDNIAAKRLLAHSLVAQNSQEKAAVILKEALQQAQMIGNRREQARLNYWAGINKLQNREFEAGLDFLSLAAEEAEALKDWLYLGYIAEYRGHAQRAMGNLSVAQEWYQTAISYHQVIQCPYGHALGLMNVARVAYELGDVAGSFAHTESALGIIEKRELYSLKKEVTTWMTMLKEQASSAKE